MAKRSDAEFLEIVICEFREKVELNFILSERLCILTETKSFEPLRDVVSHGALLRQAGFAEAVDHAILEILGVKDMRFHVVRCHASDFLDCLAALFGLVHVSK